MGAESYYHNGVISAVQISHNFINKQPTEPDFCFSCMKVSEHIKQTKKDVTWFTCCECGNVFTVDAEKE